MLAIAQKLGFQDLTTFRASLKTNPKLHPASREALLAAYQRLSHPHAGQAAPALRPPAQGQIRSRPGARLPGEDLRPRLLRSTARPTAAAPAACSSTPTTPPTAISISVEDIAYHEGIPGHHLQISIAQELTDVPTFRKYQDYTAYVEGWGSTPSGWARMSASTRTPTPTTAAWRATSGAPFGWSSTPASTPSTGPASRWSSTSTTTRTSTTPAFSPRSTAILPGPARPWPTRSAS